MTEVEDLPIDEKGRIAIPKRLRESLGLQPGEKLSVSVRGKEIRLKPVVRKTVKIRAQRRWGAEAFLDSGEALFAGEE